MELNAESLSIRKVVEISPLSDQQIMKATKAGWTLQEILEGKKVQA